jgi:hypothetical protein
MGIHLSLVNYDRRFETLVQQPTIINDLPAFTAKDMEQIHKTIYTRHTPDLLSNVPRCECGELTMEYRVGMICSTCGTAVAHALSEKLETLTWIRAPKGVRALFNPTAWTLLSSRFSIGSFNLIQYLTDPFYKVPDNQTARVQLLIDAIPFKRGFNQFYDKFDEIINYLFELKMFKLSRAKARSSPDFLRTLVREDRASIFAKRIPIPHRSLLVVEDGTTGGVYLDEYTPKAINAVLTLAGIDTAAVQGEVSTNLRLRESRAVRAVQRLAEYHYYVCTKRLAKKEGIFRKQVWATRSHWSFRAVISSITEPHKHEEIYIPWGVAVGVFQIHLYNKLFNLGMTPNEIQEFLNAHASRYHPLLHELFTELINESSDPKGISATLNRPPSLKRGSEAGR